MFEEVSVAGEAAGSERGGWEIRSEMKWGQSSRA